MGGGKFPGSGIIKHTSCCLKQQLEGHPHIVDQTRLKFTSVSHKCPTLRKIGCPEQVLRDVAQNHIKKSLFQLEYHNLGGKEIHI